MPPVPCRRLLRRRHSVRLEGAGRRPDPGRDPGSPLHLLTRGRNRGGARWRCLLRADASTFRAPRGRQAVLDGAAFGLGAVAGCNCTRRVRINLISTAWLRGIERLTLVKYFSAATSSALAQPDWPSYAGSRRGLDFASRARGDDELSTLTRALSTGLILGSALLITARHWPANCRNGHGQYLRKPLALGGWSPSQPAPRRTTGVLRGLGDRDFGGELLESTAARGCSASAVR